MVRLVRLANVFLVGLVAGAVFGIWLGYDPASLSASAYIEQQQHAILALNVVIPVLGALCIMLTLAHAFLVRATRATFSLLVLGAALFVVAGLVTRFGNQPVNAVVMTWDASAPPSGWEQARDQWWTWHVARTVASLAGFICVIAASVNPIAPARDQIRELARTIRPSTTSTS